MSNDNEQETRDALENAQAALETAVRTCMLAREVILNLQDKLAAQEAGSDPMATFAPPADVPQCAHEQVKVVPSMGDSEVAICFRCDAVLKDGVVQDG